MRRRLASDLDVKSRRRPRALFRGLASREHSGSLDAWTDELRRRVEDIEKGEVELLRLDEVKRRMAERRARRRARAR